MIMLQRSDFPSSFVFGAATSAYQIEGHGFGGAGPTHWDVFAAAPGKVVNGENGAVACDHYHRFAADLDLLRGFDGYRFSTSWARILPEGRGQINAEGLDFYDRLVDAILARGLLPFQTLYHWELPAAMAARGGWTNRDVTGWFGDFAETISRRIGDRVHAVATINEPWCIAYLSHFLGQHAPGLRDLPATARAMHYVLLAHAEAMDRLRAMGQKNLGIVLNFDAVQIADDIPENAVSTELYDAILNRWFIQALTCGTYPDEALAGFAPHLPQGWQDDMERISQPLDWLGVNYYTRQIIAADARAPWPHFKCVSGPLPKSQMGWEIYPEGLHKILRWLDADYCRGLPLYVTENGIACDDQLQNGKINDTQRNAYIDQHLNAVLRAIQDGVNVAGYFYWSLLDNFEWAQGYEKRFGLIHVDFDTQKRTPKASYFALKDAFANG